MATAVRESLRDLLEMHACAMLMSGSVSRKTIGDKELRDLGTSLPFTREPDLGLALVVKSYLDELSNEPAKRQDITRWFNYVTDMEGDLQKAWKLWACVRPPLRRDTAATAILIRILGQRRCPSSRDEHHRREREEGVPECRQMAAGEDRRGRCPQRLGLEGRPPRGWPDCELQLRSIIR